MHPFLASELESAFDLSAALETGLVPLVVASKDPTDVLRTYVSLYLKEEVQAEGLTRNVGAFSRFLEGISFSHGASLNVASVSRECQVERKTVESYVTILEDLLLAWRLPVFTRRAQRALTAHPKLYMFDTGVFRSLRPSGPLDSPDELHGAALEGLVAQHLKAWNEYGNHDCSLSFWRTRGGIEVDFVLYGPRDFWAIEVKNTADVRSKDLKPLKEFHRDYPECRPLFVYRGKDRLLRDGVLCLPCVDFLRGLVPGKALV